MLFHFHVISRKMFRSADLPKTGRNETPVQFQVYFSIHYIHTLEIFSCSMLSPQQIPQRQPYWYRYLCNIQLEQNWRMIYCAKQVNKSIQLILNQE